MDRNLFMSKFYPHRLGVLTLLTLLLVIGCEKPIEQVSDPNTEIRAALNQQQKSWNEGDIPGFMEYYWNNDSLQFVSKNGITYGHRSVLENYQKSYPNKERMGTLTFDVIQIINGDNNSATVVGSWNLSYANEDSVGGYFSLLWKRKKQGWRIVLDHTS